MSKNNKYNPSRMPSAKGMDIASVYLPKECASKAKNIVLSPDNENIVEELLTILQMKDKFFEHEVPVPNKLMMFGQPGSGKTLTAFHLAHRLELPLVLARLDTLIHAHLGETGTNVL